MLLLEIESCAPVPSTDTNGCLAINVCGTPDDVRHALATSPGGKRELERSRGCFAPLKCLAKLPRHHPPEDVSTTHSESVDHFLEHTSKTTRDIVQALSVIPDSIGFRCSTVMPDGPAASSSGRMEAFPEFGSIQVATDCRAEVVQCDQERSLLFGVQVRPQLLLTRTSLRKALPSAPDPTPCSRGVRCHRTVVLISCDGSTLHWLQQSHFLPRKDSTPPM